MQPLGLYQPLLFLDCGGVSLIREGAYRGCNGLVNLHDPANVQQTSSKCIQNTRANAGRLLDVCCNIML